MRRGSVGGDPAPPTLPRAGGCYVERDTSGHVLIRVEPDVRWCTAEEMAEAERRAVERTGRALVAWLIGRWRR